MSLEDSGDLGSLSMPTPISPANRYPENSPAGKGQVGRSLGRVDGAQTLGTWPHCKPYICPFFVQG